MDIMTFLRLKNRLLGMISPETVAKQNARLFLSPRNHALKDWEHEAEKQGERLCFGDSLSAIRWGKSDKRILVMHGWESRATQMFGIADVLARRGFEVIAIDAPKHGHSKGEKSNPVEFANAIAAADKAFGPFYGAVGHSMGATALAIARDKGINLGRYALISSPACIYDSLKAFAGFMGLSEECTKRFVHNVEQEVGRPARELDVGDLLGSHDESSLLVHAKDDKEIPYEAMQRICDKLSNVKTVSPIDLGHRKIVRDEDVAASIHNFLSQSSSLREVSA